MKVEFDPNSGPSLRQWNKNLSISRIIKTYALHRQSVIWAWFVVTKMTEIYLIIP